MDATRGALTARQTTAIIGLAVVVLVPLTAVVYFGTLTSNPPAFYIDESSVAFNAWSIAHDGRDEHGVRLPLFFRALDDYKNPTFTYFLALVFKVVPPSDSVARAVASGCGIATALVLGALASRITASRLIASLTTLTVLFTPMLFEISRLVFEVALYPLLTACFLWAVYAASRRPRWTTGEVVTLTVTLVLLSYSYSIGRMLAPLLAVLTLSVFYTRQRRSAVIAIAIAFLLIGVAPIAAYNAIHDGALTRRFLTLTYVGGSTSTVGEVWEVCRHHFVHLDPIGMSVVGDADQRNHVSGSGGAILFVTFALAMGGAVLSYRTSEWWRFVALGTLLAIVPASLTMDTRHALRLAPYPVFLILLSVPALQWLRARPRIALTAAALGTAQIVFFFSVFYREGPKRGAWFDAGAREVVNAALDTRAPVALRMNWGYIHAYWYAVQRGTSPDFFRLPNPRVVIGEGDVPTGTRVIRREGKYATYFVQSGP